MSLFYEVASHLNKYHPVLASIPEDKNFPFTRLLRKLLTVEEARFLLHLTDQSISAKQFSALVGLSVSKVRDDLNVLSKKGVIFVEEDNGELKYKLLAICPGLLEAVMAIHDEKDIAIDVQEFLSYIHDKTAEAKVFSLNKTIDTRSYKLSHEEVNYYLDSTDSYALTDCACRKLQKNANKACGHPIEDMCIILGKYADFYIRTNRGKRATREEVEQVLEKAEKLGMYHQVFSSECVGKSAFICNCCSCGCISMWISNSIDLYLSEELMTQVSIDASKCIGCGDCARTCPAEVFIIPSGKKVPIIAGNNCFSCGLCEALCPSKAITIQ